jgi:two-component system, OmpR family, KDP operon response regulator KdpE
MNTLLVVEDDSGTAATLTDLLQRHGYQAERVSSVRETRLLLKQSTPLLVLLDVQLSDGSGYELAADLKAAAIPFIVISVRRMESDVVMGFELGADDYIRKPVEGRELLARVRRTLERRAAAPEGGAAEPNLILETGQMIVRLPAEKRSVPLSPLEFAILTELHRNGSAYLSSSELLQRVWHKKDTAEGFTHVRVAIRRLREKIEPDPFAPRYILNKRGQGYRLNATAAVQPAVARGPSRRTAS